MVHNALKEGLWRFFFYVCDGLTEGGGFQRVQLLFSHKHTMTHAHVVRVRVSVEEILNTSLMCVTV